MVALAVAPVWRARGEHGDRARLATAAVVYMLSARVCHQRPERSFRVAGQAMPVCGRCTGLYVSGALGLLASVAVRRRRARPGRHGWPRAAGGGFGVRWPASLDRRAGWLALAAVPALATWTLEVAGLWDPGTALRAIAALPLGAAAGWFVGRTLRSS